MVRAPCGCQRDAMSLHWQPPGPGSTPRWSRLTTLPPTFFAVPFGLSSLAAGWSAAERAVGVPAAVADLLLVVSAVLWSVLVLGLLVRLKRAPRALAAQLRDPVV